MVFTSILSLIAAAGMVVSLIQLAHLSTALEKLKIAHAQLSTDALNYAQAANADIEQLTARCEEQELTLRAFQRFGCELSIDFDVHKREHEAMFQTLKSPF